MGEGSSAVASRKASLMAVGWDRAYNSETPEAHEPALVGGERAHPCNGDHTAARNRRGAASDLT
jgi:hypothetical protein